MCLSAKRHCVKLLRVALIVCSAVLLFAPWVRAQSITGSITGSVQDASNAAVPGANITLTEVATSAERRATTDDRGDFGFNALMPGTYRLAMQVPGFKTFVREGIQLTASERLSLGNLALEVGAAEQNVTVRAEGVAVETASAEHSALITSMQASALEIRGRNVTSMMRLLPGVVDTAEGASGEASGNSNSEENISKFFYFDVEGTRANATNITLDGLTLNELGGDAQINVAVGLDAIAEAKVMLGNYPAEYGRMNGGNIELVVKSGTRDIHGGGSYFTRNEDFNANNFFNNRLGLPRTWYRFNTLNYNISGPIYIPRHFNKDRNKLFVFWTQEYWPLKVTNPAQEVTVPTALERTGNFSQSLNSNGSLIVVNDPTTKAPFPGNIIPQSRANPDGQALLNFFPAANFLNRAVSAGNYNYVSQIIGVTPNHVNTWKNDYNIDSNNLLTFTFSEHVRREQSDASRSSVSWPMNSVTIRSRSLFFSWHWTHIFSPTLVNEVNTGWNQHHGWDTIDPDQLALIQGATTGWNPGELYTAKNGPFGTAPNPLGLVPQASFGGVPSAATIAFGGNYPLNNDREIYDFADNLTKVAGSHTFKVGVWFEHKWDDDGPTQTYGSGYFNFGTNTTNPLDTGYAYSNALLGNFYQYQQGSAIVDPEYRSRDIDWFVQDSWRATRRLTIDYGVRFYHWQPYFEARGMLTSFELSQFNPAQTVRLIQPALVGGVRVGVSPVNGTVYSAAAIGAIAPGSGNATNGMVLANSPLTYGPSLTATPPVQVAPRVGLAYDPFGKGKTAIRGGFGIFYDDPPTGSYPLATQYPIITTPIISNSNLSTFLTAPGLIYPQSVLSVDPKIKLPSSLQFNAAVQQDVGFGTVVEVGYVANLGRHLLWERQMDSIPLGADFSAANIDPTTGKALASQFETPITGYSSINSLEAATTSNYNALQVSANRRFARHLQVGFAWTWSKTMDYTDSDTGTVSPLVPLSYYYGLASFDRTYAVKVNWVYDLPNIPSHWAPAERIFNNWQFVGIASFVSGAPTTVTFTTTNGADITGTSSLGPRVNVVCSPKLSSPTFSQNFNTSCFQLPAVGTVGDAGKDTLRGPGINNFDLSLFKNFTIRERVHLSFRADAYNALNHTQFSAFNTAAQFSPSGQQVNTALGQYTTARNGRIGELSLRATF